MTSDVNWEPSIYDNIIDNMNEFFDSQEEDIHNDSPYNDVGEYRHRTVATYTIHAEIEFFDT
jgi:hypothetical protein